MRSDKEDGMDKITFVRHYKSYGEDVFDVLYKSNRLCSYYGKDVPATVLRFMEGKEPKRQTDKYWGDELIYK